MSKFAGAVFAYVERFTDRVLPIEVVDQIEDCIVFVHSATARFCMNRGEPICHIFRADARKVLASRPAAVDGHQAASHVAGSVAG